MIWHFIIKTVTQTKIIREFTLTILNEINENREIIIDYNSIINAMITNINNVTNSYYKIIFYIIYVFEFYII